MDAKDREIAELKSLLQAARAEIAELKAQFKKDSRTSSRQQSFV